MRISINLATQPFEDVRAFAARWGLGLLLLALVTGALAYKAVEGWRSTRSISARINADQDQIRQFKQEITAANTELNRPANRDIRMQSAFLNTLIVRKAFSWTEAFNTLEKIMPPRIHVVSMQPELDEQNQLTLKMRVAGAAGDSRDSLLTLLRRMESTPQFQQPQLLSEAPGKQGQEEFQISSLYVPSLPSGETSLSEQQPEPKGGPSAATTTAKAQNAGGR